MAFVGSLTFRATFVDFNFLFLSIDILFFTFDWRKFGKELVKSSVVASSKIMPLLKLSYSVKAFSKFN